MVVAVVIAAAVAVLSLVAYPTISRLQGEQATRVHPTATPDTGLQNVGGPEQPGGATGTGGEFPVGTVTTTGAPTDQPTTDGSAGELGAGTSTAAAFLSSSSSPRPSRTAASSPSSSTSGQSGDIGAKAAARAMLPEFGFADSEFGCLNSVWTQLNLWGSPAQVRPGLAYIKTTYGTPCAARAHLRDTGEY
jgi:hypothetical protein